MRTENDSQIVDFLYDDLSPEDRKAFLGRLDEDPELAAQARSYSTVLGLVRDHGDELAPSVSSSERLVEEARRQSLPWTARLFRLWLPALAHRPAVAIATVAVLVLGVGVFTFLSGRGEPEGVGPSRSRREAKSSSVPAAARALEKSAAVDEASSGLRDARDPSSTVAAGEAEADKNEALAFAEKPKRKEGEEQANLDASGRKDGRLALGAADNQAEAKQEQAPSRPQARRVGIGYYDDDGQGLLTRGGGGAAVTGESRQRVSLAKTPAEKALPPPQTVPVAASPRARPSKGALNTFGHQAISGQVQLAKPGPSQGGAPQVKAGDVAAKDAKRTSGSTAAETRSAPVLYNLATTNMTKGNLSQACDLFAALVRTHRAYPHRVDALLGWARCEMSRGAFGRAEQIVQQLVKEHPSWRKTGESVLAEIQKQRQLAVLRAQRKMRAAKRQQAPAKAAPRRAASSTTSY